MESGPVFYTKSTFFDSNFFENKICKKSLIFVYIFTIFVASVLFELKSYGNRFTFNPKHFQFCNPPPNSSQPCYIPYLIVKRTHMTWKNTLTLFMRASEISNVNYVARLSSLKSIWKFTMMVFMRRKSRGNVNCAMWVFTWKMVWKCTLNPFMRGKRTFSANSVKKVFTKKAIWKFTLGTIMNPKNYNSAICVRKHSLS